MSERNFSGRVDERRIPTQRQRQQQVSLHEILLATATQAAEQAQLIVGHNGRRRIAGYVQDLMRLATTDLAAKWGVDPKLIPAQQVRVVHLVYQKPQSALRKISPTEPMIRQRTPSQDEQNSQRDKPTPTVHEPQEGLKSSAVQSTHELALESILSERPLGRALAVLRMNKKLSQQTLGDLIGVSKSLMDKIERGVRNIKPSLVDDICTQLGLEKESLIRKLLVEKALAEERNQRRSQQTRRRVRVITKN